MLLGVLLMLMSCGKTPSHVIPPHKMAQLLADIHRGESAVDMNRRDYSTDSAKLALREAIYRRHNVDQKMVDTSYYWYGHHIEEYMKVYTEVVDILQQELDNTSANLARMQIAAVGDSADTWSYPSRFVIDRNTVVPHLAMMLLPDENWEKGDNYTLNFKLINATTPVRSTLAAVYDDGRIEWIENQANENGMVSYTLVTDSTVNLAKIFTSIDVEPKTSETVFIDSLSLVRTRVNRSIYPKRYNNRKITPLKAPDKKVDKDTTQLTDTP